MGDFRPLTMRWMGALVLLAILEGHQGLPRNVQEVQHVQDLVQTSAASASQFVSPFMQGPYSATAMPYMWGQWGMGMGGMGMDPMQNIAAFNPFNAYGSGLGLYKSASRPSRRVVGVGAPLCI